MYCLFKIQTKIIVLHYYVDVNIHSFTRLRILQYMNIKFTIVNKISTHVFMMYTLW